MPSITSGLTTFNLDVDELIEQALEPCGGEHTSAEEVKKARRVLNLLLIEMQNKNIPLSKIDFETVTLLTGIATYALNTNIISVLESTISLSDPVPQNNVDIKIESKSIQEYHVIPNKLNSNRPNCYMVQRLANNVSVTVWPVPNVVANGPYLLKMVVSRKIEDVTASYQKINIHTKYLPLITAWLSYRLSIARVGVAEEVRNRLKTEYMEMYADTVEEDREKTDFFARPGGITGR